MPVIEHEELLRECPEHGQVRGLAQLAAELTSNGFRPRSMIKMLLSSPAYRSANNFSSTVIRQGGAQ